MTIEWGSYRSGSFHDELIDPRGEPYLSAKELAQHLTSLPTGALETLQKDLERAIVELGITFTVYSDGKNIDRAWPLDIIPRVIDAREWARTVEGLEQRLTALNLFIDDLYHEQRIVQEGIVPRELVATSPDFREACRGVDPPRGVWAHICGTDLIRDRDGTMYVLEDNLRVPSGVSYMLENRVVIKHVFPDLFDRTDIAGVEDYPSDLFDMLASISPRPVDYPKIVVLTPGIYNSAYFEHAFLAQRMGVELVEGGDLVVDDDDCVYMKTIEGLERVDVIYRRVNDTFLDPECFRSDSVLGVRGLMRAWRAKKVAIANAPGAGVADDKAIYSYVPDIIRYYLASEPILASVPTWRCSDGRSCTYVIEKLEELVVKPTNESGGYGMIIGPQASKKELEHFKTQILEKPRNYIAQPLIALSTVPTLVGSAIEPRHVDLRPFVLQGEETRVTAGGLTRVAMTKGSFVVNSSQGGGSKDTWVVKAAS